ncbi:MAG: SDR family oxidoreductase [Halioglobus sp.]
MSKQQETVLITGASSGIGEALAWVFAEHGHDLILVARSVAKLDKLADALAKKYDVIVSVRPADLSEAGSAESLAKVLNREGLEVNILVNNAGVLEHGNFIDMEPDDHQRMLRLNIAGLTDILAYFLPDMVSRGSGRILNVASIGAFQPVPSLATYAATKAYVLSLSEALAEELRDTGVSITVLCPGITETNMVASAGSMVDHLPSMLIGDVEKVAREAFKACMKGKIIVVPGTLNLATTLAARTTPKWLVRRLMGLAGRSTL